MRITSAKIARIVSIALLSGLTGPIVLPPTPAKAAVFVQDGAAEWTGIEVSGVGEVTVKPDIARITLGVQTQGKDSTQVSQENASKITAIIAAVKAAGVEEKYIQTVGYSIQPQYVYDQNGNKPPTITGYLVTNSVRIRIDKIADAGKALDAGIKAGANNASGIEFDLADPEKAKDEALAKAVADANRKAKVIAKASGLRSIKLAAVSEVANSDDPRPMYANTRAVAEIAQTPIQAGELKITANITVRFVFTDAPETAP